MSNNLTLRSLLDEIECFILDMDGTIYLGDHLFPFTLDFLHAVEQSGKTYRFFTNNSSRNRQAYLDKLHRMGLFIPTEWMLTANQVAIQVLNDRFPSGNFYVVGTPSLVQEMEEAGLSVNTGHQPDAVVVGFDTTLTYEKVWHACRYIRHGAALWGINQDWNCPVEDGESMPDCGSIVRLIEASTGILPEFCGKPTIHTRNFLFAATGLPPEKLCVIGDRLYTDIALASNTPMTSILVLTGETTKEDLAHTDTPPDFVLESLADLTGYLLHR